MGKKGVKLEDGTPDRGTTVDDAARDVFDLLGGDDEFVDDDKREDESRSDDQASDESEDEERSDDSEEDEEAKENSETLEEDDGDEEDPDASEEETDEPSEETRTHRVTVDGEEEEVTLEELTKGYSRQSDYTRKTQAVAKTKKELAGELAQTQQARTEYGQRLQALEQLIQMATPAEPDWNKLRAENPDDFAVLYADYQRQQDSVKAVTAEQSRVLAETQKEQVKVVARIQEEEKELLSASIPEWTDSDVAKAEKQELVAYAEKLGFTTEQLANVIDHRVVVMLRKAMLHDRITTTGRKELRQKKVKAKTLKPGQPRARARSKTSRKAQVKTRKRLTQSGKLDDAAAVLFGMEETEI